jgi:hypothetical protein
MLKGGTSPACIFEINKTITNANLFIQAVARLQIFGLLRKAKIKRALESRWNFFYIE